MNLALMLLKKNKTKVQQTTVVNSWLDTLEEVNLINFVKLKRCLHNQVHDANFDINEDGKVDAADHTAWIDYLVSGTVPARFVEVS